METVVITAHELKQVRVPSLPTRNGNSDLGEAFEQPFPFPAYLQGMETANPEPGCRVPGAGSQPTYKEWKRLRFFGIGPPGFRSQPTYKEWKRRPGRRSPGGFSCSQPTYKEWKRSPSPGPGLVSPPFPAYLQGMETIRGPALRTGAAHVPSLPTRNGNANTPSISGWTTYVPSLPTRNGNGP